MHTTTPTFTIAYRLLFPHINILIYATAILDEDDEIDFALNTALKQRDDKLKTNTQLMIAANLAEVGQQVRGNLKVYLFESNFDLFNCTLW